MKLKEAVSGFISTDQEAGPGPLPIRQSEANHVKWPILGTIKWQHIAQLFNAVLCFYKTFSLRLAAQSCKVGHWQGCQSWQRVCHPRDCHSQLCIELCIHRRSFSWQISPQSCLAQGSPKSHSRYFPQHIAFQ